MRTDRELLEYILHVLDKGQWIHPICPLHDEIRARLAEPEDEPAAWMDIDGNVSDNNDCNCFPIPLYRHPPRQPVRLSDEEIREVMLAHGFVIKDGHSDLKPYVFQAARAIEQAVLGKNQ